MQIGVSTLVGLEPIPFPDLVRWCAAHGIYALEVNVGPGYPKIGGASYGGHLDLDAIVRDGRGIVEDALGDSGVKVVSLAPMVNLLSADLELRATRIALMRQCIDAAHILGLDTVVTFAGSSFGMNFSGLPGVGGRHSSNKIADNIAIFTEVYGPIADYAESKGIRIAFETAGRGGPEGNIAHSPVHVGEDVRGRAIEGARPELRPVAPGLAPHPQPGRRHPRVRRSHLPRRRQGLRGHARPAWPARASSATTGGAIACPAWVRVPWAEVFSALRDVGYDGIVAIENEDPLCPGLNGAAWAADYLNRLILPDPSKTVVEPIRPTAAESKGTA